MPEEIEPAKQAPAGGELEQFIRSHSAADLVRVSADPRLTQDLAFSLLQRRDLPGEALEAMSKNGAVNQYRRVMLSLVGHPKTPRHVSLGAMRHLYPFELMQLALSPTVLADIKHAAEEAIIARLEQTSLGERFTMARRASGRVAAVLLLDSEARVIEAALDNPFLTEVLIIRALKRKQASAALVERVCRHSWSQRAGIRMALLQNRSTPAERLSEYIQSLSNGLLREVLAEAAVPASTRTLLGEELERRGKAKTV
jgi:hypothetical protein